MPRVNDSIVAGLISNAGLDEQDFARHTEALARDLRDERAAHAETKRKLDEAVELCDGVYTVRRSAWECAICGQDSTMFPRHSADCYGARFETFLSNLEDK